MKALITYGTKYGSTAEVANYIFQILKNNAYITEIKPIQEVKGIESYDTIIIGAPLLMFHLQKDVKKFLNKFTQKLQNKNIYLFILGPTHDPYDEAEWKDSWNQLHKELALYPLLKIKEIAMFGGKFDLSKLSFLFKWFAKNTPNTDIRDWDQIKKWAEKIVNEKNEQFK